MDDFLNDFMEMFIGFIGSFLIIILFLILILGPVILAGLFSLFWLLLYFLALPLLFTMCNMFEL